MTERSFTNSACVVVGIAITASGVSLWWAVIAAIPIVALIHLIWRRSA